MEPLPIPLIKEMYNGKSDGDFVKLNFLRYPTSSMSYLYEFKISLFEHGDPETFLLFIRDFNINLTAIETLEVGAKIWYLCTLVRGEALLQFDLLSADVENTETLNVDNCIKFSVVFFPVNYISKQKCSMCHRILKNSQLKSKTVCDEFD